MTQDEMIELAKQAGWQYAHGDSGYEPLWAFAKLVAAKEREACAKLCENMTLEWEDQPEFARIELSTMMDCALAIRARGEQA